MSEPQPSMALEARDTRLMEHLAVTAQLRLEAFCDTLREAMELPRFGFDAENETEWGWTHIEGGLLEINVSRPYEPGTLQEWDPTVPAGCNFGISLIVSKAAPESWTHEWAAAGLVPRYARAIAGFCGSEVYHHCTWFGPGQYVTRDGVFSPDGETLASADRLTTGRDGTSYRMRSALEDRT